MKPHGNKKSTGDFFMGLKQVRNILPIGYVPSAEEEAMLAEFFNEYPDEDRSGVWRKNIAIWIVNSLGDWVARREALSKCQANGLEWHKLMYGDNWKTTHTSMVDRLKKQLKNTREGWADSGLSEEEITQKIKKVQQERGRKFGAMSKGTGLYSVRSKDYWIRNGYSEDEAIDIVTNFQKRDLAFFIDRYGIEEGTLRHQQSIDKRKETWKTKDRYQHAMVTLPKSFNPNGKEMQAIRGFIAANDINILCCRFGAPSEQFWQNISNVGYRRYDLAVYEDETHKKLKLIFEFHGPGHINFSDYRDELEHVPITIGQRTLTHLGTYGESYKNDLAKRNHILEKYPDVMYVVMWCDDLFNKRFTINELL